VHSSDFSLHTQNKYNKRFTNVCFAFTKPRSWFKDFPKYLPSHTMATPACSTYLPLLITTILFAHLTKQISITKWCTTAAHPPKISFFLKLISNHHGLACSLQCLHFLPLPTIWYHFKQGCCLQIDNFSPCTFFQKLVMTEFADIWLADCYSHFAYLLPCTISCHFHFSCPMTFNDLNKYHELP